jgi:DNA-binding transcriptional regulator YiaG
MAKDSSTSIVQEDISSPKARGRRIRAIRKGLRFGRPALQRKYDIRVNTLQGWEDGRRGGLTEGGAKQLVALFNAEGAPCTVEWLLYGSGPNPLDCLSSFKRGVGSLTTFPTLAEELQLFYKAYPNSVDVIISDESMAPCFLPGDYVAGPRYFGEEIINALNRCCIAHTATHGILVRVLTAGAKKDRYTLAGLNAQTSEAVIPKDIPVFSAAPIIWFRRPMNLCP